MGSEIKMFIPGGEDLSKNTPESDSILVANEAKKNMEMVLNTSGNKSKVIPLKSAERPRESIYSMISVSDAMDIILQESDTLNRERKHFPAYDKSEIRNVIGVITPGTMHNFLMMPGHCIRVSTGSAIPGGANAVIQVEDTQVAEKDNEGNELKIRILKQATPQQDIRPVGSDVAEGQLLIPANSRISAAEMGVLAGCGIEDVVVFLKPRVALLSTGDEILQPGSMPKQGCIRDSNKSSLTYMLMENRIPVVDVGIARDTPDEVKSQLTKAFESAEIVITTGGVSMGEKDILKQVLKVDFDATIHFGRVEMKPGKPATFSTAWFQGQKKLIFSLPGNPVSAFVCFYLFVIPCIKKLMGYAEVTHSTINVKLGHDLKLDERPEFYRVFLKCDIDGVFVAHGTGKQQSSRLLSMQKADALLVLPPAEPKENILKKGTFVEAILLKNI